MCDGGRAAAGGPAARDRDHLEMCSERMPCGLGRFEGVACVARLRRLFLAARLFVIPQNG